MQGFSVGKTLSRSFSIFGANFVPFCLIAGVVELPVLLLTAYQQYLAKVVRPNPLDTTALSVSMLVLLATLLLTPLATASVTFGVLQQLRGRRASVGDCLVVGLQRMFPVMGISLVAGII